MSSVPADRLKAALTACVEEERAADLAAISRVVKLLDANPRLLDEFFPNLGTAATRTVGLAPGSPRPVDVDITMTQVTNVEAIRRYLEQHPGWRTAPEIATALGLKEGATRTVLYGKKELFESRKLDGRRVAWRLADAEYPEQTNAA